MAQPARPAVLVVDDDDGIRAALTVVLEEDYEVLTAEDGPKALQLLRSRPPDVVLLDILLPGMNGLDVLARMREAGSEVPVILVTAIADVPIVVKGMRLGALDYVTKPWDEPALLASVRQAAGRRQGEPGRVLLIGADMGPLAALQLALERDFRVTTVAPAAVALAAVEGAPALVLFDSALPPEPTARFVRALRERIARATLMVMTTDIQAALCVPELAALAPAALVEKPYCLNEVLGRLGALLSPRGRLNRSWERVGAHALRAIDHMAGHFQEPLRVADVARAVGLSADRLAHVFHDGLGMALTDYLERLRVAVGRRLLAETDVKLEEVARGCGFADASHFSRVFVNHIGMRPGAYRRRSAGIGNDQANAVMERVTT